MKIVTFGELLLRFSPTGYERFFQTPQMLTSFCGAEANVSVALRMFGKDSAFVTKLPNNAVGKAAKMELQKYGVDVSRIITGGERLGIIFAEKGASQRPSKVVYDRKHSAIAQADPTEFDWDNIFGDVDWFHVTGITPALSPQMSQACMDAVKIAADKGITVSLDINYRSNLWTKEEANSVITRIMPYVDVCIGNEEDAQNVLGIQADGSDVEKGIIDRSATAKVARIIANKYNCRYVAFSQRRSITASDNDWFGALYSTEQDKMCYSREYSIRIVDRIGGGDAFAAGLIYSLHSGYDVQQSIEFAAAAGCLDQTLEGDFCLLGADEVWALVNGDTTGRVKR